MKGQTDILDPKFVNFWIKKLIVKRHVMYNEEKRGYTKDGFAIIC